MKHLEEQIATVEKEYSELEEIWRADKALVAGNKDIQVKLDQARIALEKPSVKVIWLKQHVISMV